MSVKISVTYTWKNKQGETIQEFFSRQKQQLQTRLTYLKQYDMHNEVDPIRSTDAMLWGIDIEPYWLACQDIFDKWLCRTRLK